MLHKTQIIGETREQPQLGSRSLHTAERKGISLVPVLWLLAIAAVAYWRWQAGVALPGVVIQTLLAVAVGLIITTLVEARYAPERFIAGGLDQRSRCGE